MWFLLKTLYTLLHQRQSNPTATGFFLCGFSAWWIPQRSLRYRKHIILWKMLISNCVFGCVFHVKWLTQCMVVQHIGSYNFLAKCLTFIFLCTCVTLQSTTYLPCSPSLQGPAELFLFQQKWRERSHKRARCAPLPQPCFMWAKICNNYTRCAAFYQYTMSTQPRVSFKVHPGQLEETMDGLQIFCWGSANREICPLTHFET